MTTDPSFHMTVEDVFKIRGRGTVVTGKIETGTLRVGDEVVIKGGERAKDYDHYRDRVFSKSPESGESRGYGGTFVKGFIQTGCSAWR
jgi:elongation factor Tu